jgi:hypothetical protein
VREPLTRIIVDWSGSWQAARPGNWLGGSPAKGALGCRAIRTLRATWGAGNVARSSGLPGAPVLDPTCGSRGRATASGDPVGGEKSSSLPRTLAELPEVAASLISLGSNEHEPHGA